MNNIPTVLLTFDVEEFDLPAEYGYPLSLDEQMDIGQRGTGIVENILRKYRINSTLFTTAAFAETYPEMIRRLSADHEIASHTYRHSRFETADLLKSKNKLEEIIDKKITGLRMPRMKQVPVQDIMAAGYSYDSSLNPTYIPGRYNHRDKPRLAFNEKGILRIPASVTPNLRIPLFWLTFKNFPYSLYQKLALQTLRKDGVLSLYFHPWEFTPIGGLGLPAYITRRSGPELAEKLELLISDLQKEASFQTMEQYIAGLEKNRPGNK